MIRIWNYNKSRIHSTRGVRHISIRIDEQLIFFGEIKSATGSDLTDLGKLSEYIMFTDQNFILDEIERNDWISQLNNSNQNFYPEDFIPQIQHDSEIKEHKIDNIKDLSTEVKSNIEPERP